MTERLPLVAGFLIALKHYDKEDITQYIYFGLIPFLLAAWFVYRSWYKKREMHDGTLGANLLYLLIFSCIYIWRFGLIAGVSCGVLVLVIWLVWGNAVKSLEKKKQGSK